MCVPLYGLLFHLISFKVKLAVSGSWESALLKVTWPDDLPPDETLVSTYSEKYSHQDFCLEKLLLRRMGREPAVESWTLRACSGFVPSEVRGVFGGDVN